jgi:hypothetical protein
MPTPIEVTEKIQGGVLKAVETSQAWTLGALRSTSSAFDGIKPDPSLIPLADKMPTATETLDVAFGFFGKLLEAQHAFLAGMVDVYAPKAPATMATPTVAKVTAVPPTAKKA